jgi:hypothetical protein
VHSIAYPVQDHAHGRPVCTLLLMRFRIMCMGGLCALCCLYSGFVAAESLHSLLPRHSELALISKRCETGTCDNLPRGLYSNV